MMLFADSTAFNGLWDDDEWIQSAAEPTLCRLSGANQPARTIQYVLTIHYETANWLRLMVGPSKCVNK
jgi:hypothetical protein